MPPDSPVNSGSSEDSGETSGGGGGGTTSGPDSWEVNDSGELTVPNGAVSISASDIAAVQEAQEGKTITSIALPASVTTIEANAFSSCPSLTSINLENVTTIGASAFKGCTGITGTLNLSSATTIGASAFEGTNISGELNLSSATTIGASAFEGTNISGELNLSSATKIGEGAFRNTGVKNVTFGTDVKIEDGDIRQLTGAFASCTSLTTVTFKGPTEVGSMAFLSCTALKNVYGLDEVTSIGRSAFGYTGLTSVKLGAGLTTLEPNAFIGCDSLTSADLSDCTKLDTIASGMFDRCTSLQAVFLSDRIAQIGVEDQTPVFDECTNDQVTVYTKRTKDKGEITLVRSEDSSKIASIVYGATEEQWENALNGSSSGTPGGTSLLSSFSAFRDLLS